MKRKNSFILVGVFIALLLGFFVIGGADLLSTFGSSTLSLSKVDLRSSNSIFNGEAFLITFTSGQTEAQTFFGDFSASEINAELDDAEVTDGFTIEIDYKDQECIYDIYGVGNLEPVYSNLEERTWTCLSKPTLAKAYEKSGFSNIVYWGTGSTFEIGKCFAIGTDTVHPVGYLRNPTTSIEYDITVSTADGTTTKRLSSTNSGSTVFGDYAYATHQGALASATTCEAEALDEDNYAPVYKNGRWIISNKDYYNRYQSQLDSLYATNKDNRDSWRSNTNAWANTVLSGTTYNNDVENQYSKTNARVVATLDSPVQFPVTSLYIKADTLGIKTLVPSFDIIDLDTDDFQSGTTGYIQATIKNTGDETGNAVVYSQCSGSFDSSDRKTISLGAGDSTSVSIRVSGSVTQRDCDSCKVYVEWLGQTDSKSIQVCAEPQLTCTPNKKFCGISTTGRDVIKQCSSSGATYNIIETCNANEICENTECVGEDDVVEKNFFDKIRDFFRDLFSGIINFFTLLKYALVLIGSVFTFITSRFYLKKIEALEENNIVLNIISVIIAGLIGWFLFSFIYAPIFWIILVALVIWSITPFSKINLRGRR